MYTINALLPLTPNLLTSRHADSDIQRHAIAIADTDADHDEQHLVDSNVDRDCLAEHDTIADTEYDNDDERDCYPEHVTNVKRDSLAESNGNTVFNRDTKLNTDAILNGDTKLDAYPKPNWHTDFNEESDCLVNPHADAHAYRLGVSNSVSVEDPLVDTISYSHTNAVPELLVQFVTVRNGKRYVDAHSHHNLECDAERHVDINADAAPHKYRNFKPDGLVVIDANR